MLIELQLTLVGEDKPKSEFLSDILLGRRDASNASKASAWYGSIWIEPTLLAGSRIGFCGRDASA